MEGEEADTPRAVDRIDRDVPTCAPSERIGAVHERLKATGREACVVVNEQRVVLGLLGPYEFGAEAGACVEDVMEPDPSTFRPNVPIAELHEYFQKHTLWTAPITTPDGVLMGLLRRKDT